MSNSYEVWRISYQNSEQAARAAFVEIEPLRQQLAEMELVRTSLNLAKEENERIGQQLAEARAGRVPGGWREVLDQTYSSIGAGSLSENAQYERGIVEPYLDGIVDALDTLELEQQPPAGGVVLDAKGGSDDIA